jgi:hypothetical protein
MSAIHDGDMRGERKRAVPVFRASWVVHSLLVAPLQYSSAEELCMAAKSETSERRPAAKKKSAGNGGAIRNAVASGVAADTLIDLVQRLGLVDIVLGRVKSRIEETDVDELLEEATEYLRRNPEVLVVTLGAVTVATGLLVWLNNRREWDGSERRETTSRATASSSPGRVRRTTRSEEDH